MCAKKEAKEREQEEEQVDSHCSIGTHYLQQQQQQHQHQKKFTHFQYFDEIFLLFFLEISSSS